MVARQQAADAPVLHRHKAARSDSLSQRALALQQLADEVGRHQRTLELWLQELGEGQQQRSWSERLESAWVTVAVAARAIWTFELFSIEETVEVQGQTIKMRRGVTFGKSVGAVLVFMLGHWVASRLVRLMERILIKRFEVDARQARTIRCWVMTVVAVALVVLTLNLAQIPLTVFAFLGGALAIGIGFGTQTIIKNFISFASGVLTREADLSDHLENSSNCKWSRSQSG